MPSINPKPLVLITGATGHIGFRTLITLLESNLYTARISVRRESQAATLKGNDALRPYLSSVESFVVVPDITAAGAFDAAVKDVEYILHIASPIPDLTVPDEEINIKQDFLIPALHGTQSILTSAAKVSSVKRVVITSTVGVLAPKEGKSIAGPYDVAPAPGINDTFVQNPWVAYHASKLLAHHAGTRFMEENKPSFDLIRVLPAYTQGRNSLVTESSKLASGSNQDMIQLVQGSKSETPRPGCLVLVDDVAYVHVKALDTTRTKNGENFIAAGKGGKLFEWNDVNSIAGKLFPKAVDEGILPLGGELQAKGVQYDISNAENQLGYNPSGLEEMVKSLVGQYVELAENERTKN